MTNHFSLWRALASAKGVRVVLAVLLVSSGEGVRGGETAILRKDLPDRLIALTFDDGCASHATVVAPLLRKLGFNATFYVVKPGTFSPRTSHYVTYRELRAIARDGFEIGNHTSRHQPRAAIGAFLELEDYLLAHGIPKPSTVCWPMYRVNPETYPALLENGYGFGRGGHNRPYRPTADHPLDAPSFTLNGSWTMEKFISVVRQATAGKVVVLCYHGVPDIEHPWVNVDPELFAQQMQYLKVNGYKVVAMRDLADYIDVSKAATLPPTAAHFEEPGPVQLVEGDAPHVAGARIEAMARPVPRRPGKRANTRRLDPDTGIPRAITVENDTCLELNRVTANRPLILKDCAVRDLNGFGSKWSGPVRFEGNTDISVYRSLSFTGPLSGPGGFSMHGGAKGTLSMQGDNTYGGTTRLQQGTLELYSSLYGNDEALWTPDKIIVENGAELLLHVGGDRRFTAGQAGRLIKAITGKLDHNGLTAGGVIGLDTSAATGAVTIDEDLSDGRGPGGGPFVLRKQGAGTLQLSGHNTFTGPVHVARGTLSVSSFNSIAHRRPGSSLGSPRDAQNGQVRLGTPDHRRPVDCGLLYTGTGESTDRELNLVGGESTVTLDHAGTGVLRFTGAVVISGYGSGKALVLTGGSAHTAEIATDLHDPYDREEEAVLSVTKNGAGTWVLSGRNSYSGPTRVHQGRLTLLRPESLPEETELHLEGEAVVDLSFEGTITVRALYVAGVRQPAGTFSSANLEKHIRGSGSITTGSGP